MQKGSGTFKLISGIRPPERTGAAAGSSVGTGVLGADENVTIDMEAQQPQTSEEHPVVVRLTRETSLSRGAARGSVWLTFGTGAQQAFQFGISIVMARLLPRVKRQAAIVFSVAAFAQIFTDLGLTASVVQTSRLTEEVLASAFWLNALTGLPSPPCSPRWPSRSPIYMAIRTSEAS